VLFALAAALPGCASDGTVHDVAELQRDVAAAAAAAQRTRSETDARLSQVDRRSREQAAETSRQIAGLSGRLDAITADLGRISARLDEVSRRVDSLRAQSPRPATPPAAGAGPQVAAPASPPGPSATAARPVQGTPPPPSGTPAKPAVPAAPQPAPAAPGPGPAPALRSTAGAATGEEAYRAALADLSSGRYPLAVQGFRDFLRRHPDSGLADSAQYGIGEAHFSMARASAGRGQADQARREWEQSVLEFRKVTINYPRGSKVPAALYKEALALTELKQTALALARLQYLVDNFPQSAEAPLARERLAALKP
jgi:TolA-binding protein